MHNKLVPAAVLAAVAAFTLTACGSSSNSEGASGSTADGASSGKSSASGAKVTFVQGVAGDPFYETMACGAKAEAKQLGIDLDVQGPTSFDVSLQSPLVSTVVQSKPSVLFIAPDDTKGMVGPLKAAVSAGIKVGLVDTTLSDTSFTSFGISTDNVAAGRAAADARHTGPPDAGAADRGPDDHQQGQPEPPRRSPSPPAWRSRRR